VEIFTLEPESPSWWRREQQSVSVCWRASTGFPRLPCSGVTARWPLPRQC